MQARYYSSTQGRFTSVDPENAGGDITNPQSWNGYAYGSNNPLKYVDPTGLSSVCRQNGNIVSCEYAIDQVRQGNFETVTYTNSAGASATVRRADYYSSESSIAADGTPVITTNFNNTGFMKAAASVAGLLQAGMSRDESDAGAFRGFGGGRDFGGAGAGGSYQCPSCPAFKDDPYNPDVVRGRRDASNAGKSPGSVPTPSSDPFKFEHTTVKGEKAYRDPNSGEIWILDKFHKTHYEVYKNKAAAEKGTRSRDVWTDGRPKSNF